MFRRRKRTWLNFWNRKSMNLFQTSSGKRITLMRHFVYAQVAVQVGIALTPFWSNTVYAAISSSQDNNYYTGSASALGSIGQAAQQGNLSGAAAQQASGMASQQAQNWLQQFGTARIELNTDGNFKPRTGAADLLIPLYKSDDRLLFTQNGIRNVDGQFTGNFGVGQRHFVDSWMLGYNAFYDQNFSRGHKRIGTGVEAWRDYMKLSGNGYWRVSGWKNSGDVEDYDARPANGFDLRAEAWLPALPALGGRLMYEQYYGDEVALFGKDKRQRDPNAVTAGLSWTPVPLISLTADHKRGGSQSESIFGLQVNWQLGQSLGSQLDASAVGQKRILAGSGMDLVERNNNIVLEYRKQEVIKLSLPKAISGPGSSTQPIHYTVNAKYCLEKIIWNDAAITVAGGKIIDAGKGVYQLVMPKYMAGGNNAYTLSGVATDSRSNTSKIASTTITVTAPQASAENSSTVAAKTTIVADGQDTNDITVTLMSHDNAPVIGTADALKANVNEQLEKTAQAAKASKLASQPASISNAVEKGNGVYVLTLTSGTHPATLTVTPTLGDIKLKSVTVNQISDSASAVVKDGDLKLITTNVKADGLSAAQVQARVTDASGSRVPGMEVSFSLTGSAQVAQGSALKAVSDNKGYATLLFTNKVAESVTVTANTVNGGNASVTAKFIGDEATAKIKDGSLQVDRASAVANGADKILYSINVTDANNNPLANQSITWTTDGGDLSAVTSTTDANGLAKVDLTSTLAGAIQVAAALQGSASINAPGVNFIADSSNLDASKSAFVGAPLTIVADGSTESTLTLTLKDKNDNPVSAQAVTFTSSLSGTTIENSAESGNGVYTAKLKGTTAGVTDVSVSVNGVGFAVSAAQITLTADSNPDAGKSTLNASPTTIVANGTAESLITVELKDRNNNPISGQNVSFVSSLPNVTFDATSDNGNGNYTVKLTGTTAGTSDVTVRVNGAALAVSATQVTLTADSSNLDATKSRLIKSKSSIVANNTDISTITFVLSDRNNNPVSGQTVLIESSLANSSLVGLRDNGDGIYTAQLKGTKIGEASITVKVNNIAFAVNPTSVTLIADAATAAINGAITSDKTQLFANNTDVVTYTVTIKDANQNPVTGQAVVWSGNPEATTLGASAPTDSTGQTNVTLKGTREQSVVINARVNAGTPVNTSAVQFKMPEIIIDGNKPITAEMITTALANTEAVFAWLYNAHWAPTITFPSAAGLNGKSVKIVNDADYNADVTVNGTSFNLVKGVTYLYKSDGSTWVQQ